MSRVSLDILQPSAILQEVVNMGVAVVIFTKVARVVYKAGLKIRSCGISGDTHINECSG